MRFILTLIVWFSLLYSALFQYIRSTHYRDPTSYFFNPNRAYRRLYTSIRIEQADTFLKSAPDLPHSPTSSSTPPTICIGVPTVVRSGHQYVHRTIGSMLDGLSLEERKSIYLSLFIAHTDPSVHPIHGEKWTETLSDQILTYSKYPANNLTKIRVWEDNSLYRIKTIFDYTYTLQDCYNTGARYIAVIEGDTLFVKGWFKRAMQGLKEIETKMARRRQQKWIYLRLFYTERLFGWNSEFWPTYLFWSLMLFGSLNLTLVAARARCRRLQPFLTKPVIVMLSCGFLPACIILFFLAGRNSIFPLSPGIHEMNNFGCCSQGLIFPRNIVPTLIDRMDDAIPLDYLADTMIETISDQEGYVRWAIAPALLQHIGTESSKGEDFNFGASRNWNFGFELYDDSRLS